MTWIEEGSPCHVLQPNKSQLYCPKSESWSKSTTTVGLHNKGFQKRLEHEWLETYVIFAGILYNFIFVSKAHFPVICGKVFKFGL